MNGFDETLQSVYKKQHSCETALLRVQNDILMALDSGKCVILLLLDLSAAFDTVDHEILLRRLHSKFGIKGKAHAWLRSYLTGRTQFVRINGTNSSIHYHKYGVPQGSVLGPFLYLLYTSPLGDIIRKHGIDFSLYADDTQLYTALSFENDVELSVAIDRIERCLVESFKWMAVNKLKFNTDETLLVVHQSQFRPMSLRPFITVGVDTITPSDKARNIGVTFDTHLTFSYHVNDVVKEAFYHLRNIAKIRKCISVETKEILIHCFFTSKLDFCNALLYGLPKYQINKLQNVQNAAARIIARLRKYDHIRQTLKDLHWLPG